LPKDRPLIFGQRGQITEPLVFRQYTRAALDAQYNNRDRVADHDQYFDRWTKANEDVVAEFETQLDISYGPHRDETLDLFLCGQPGAPIHVFIHGGYWQSRLKDDFRFVAAGLVPLGAHVAVINYSLAPSVTMDEILRQCRVAMVWLGSNAATFGGDPKRIFVSGHSAGAT
jgi:arylformamidase